MSTFTNIITALLLSQVLVYGQIGESISEITLEESYELFSWSGNKQELQLSLVKISGYKADTFALISLQDVRKVVTGYQSGLALSSEGGLIVGGSKQKELKESGGTRKLNLEQITNLMTWINKVYVLTANPPKESTTWTLTMDQNFSMSFVFDPNNAFDEDWYIYLNLDEGSFKLPVTHSTNLLRHLREIRNNLKSL